MNINEEIRVTAEKLKQEKLQKEREELFRIKLSEEYSSAKMNKGTPVVVLPPRELQIVIEETMPYMQFIMPKVFREMSNGKTHVRRVQEYQGRYDETDYCNQHSFDVPLYTANGKGDCTVYLWIFKNGAVAFAHVNGNGAQTNVEWKDICSRKDMPQGMRELIIKQIAENKLEEKNMEDNSGCCYIATHIYGSYDCPEVLVLRQFRDNVLKKSKIGNCFIEVYYYISPKLIKRFGNFRVFNSLCRKALDYMVTRL